MANRLSETEKTNMSLDTAEIEQKIRAILTEMDGIVYQKRETRLAGGKLPIVFNYTKNQLAAYHYKFRQSTMWKKVEDEKFSFSLRYFSKDGDLALDEKRFRYIVMHEYGHYMVRHLYGKTKEGPHGSTWRNCCREIGIIPRARFSEDQRNMAWCQLFLPNGVYEEAPVSKAEYQIGDVIMHPTYGQGKVTSIEPTRLAVYLKVCFPLFEKRLDQKWVLAHCQ